MFTAVVLSPASRALLIERTAEFVPLSFEIVAHHHTLNLGEARDKNLIGITVSMVVDKIGISEKAIAVSLCHVGVGPVSDNKIPHVTVAINRTIGGKPKDSNLIENWNTIPFITLIGVIEECP